MNDWVSHIIVVCRLAKGCDEKLCPLHEFTLQRYPDAVLICVEDVECLLDEGLMKEALKK